MVRKDINTSDMHPFIHPFTAATDPAWEAKTDWEIYKYIAKAFSRLCVGHLGTQTDVVTLPMQHDSADELAQPFGGTDWKSAGENPYPALIAHSSKLWNEIIPAPMPSSLLLVL